MSFAFFRSITPSSATRAAVEDNDGVFRSPNLNWLDESRYEFGWNWGNTSLGTPLPNRVMWNPPSAISCLQSPAETERVLEGLTPRAPNPSSTNEGMLWSWWAKGPGRGGRNKVQFLTESPIAPVLSALPEFTDWAIQPHVAGTHYRLITVGHRVVQCHIREGSTHEREYRWIRMRDVEGCAKTVAREAAARLSSPHTIIGWDIVADYHDRAYVLEGNAAPGLNHATVERIVKEVRRQQEEMNT